MSFCNYKDIAALLWLFWSRFWSCFWWIHFVVVILREQQNGWRAFWLSFLIVVLWVEIDQNIWQNHELQLWVAFILCHKMRVQSLSKCKSSSKSIGSSIDKVGFLSLHHLYTILGSKYGFSSTNTKWMVAKTSSHHSSSHS